LNLPTESITPSPEDVMAKGVVKVFEEEGIAKALPRFLFGENGGYSGLRLMPGRSWAIVLRNLRFCCEAEKVLTGSLFDQKGPPHLPLSLWGTMS